MQAAAAMQTVAGGGKKTWVDILCDNFVRAWLIGIEDPLKVPSGLAGMAGRAGSRLALAPSGLVPHWCHWRGCEANTRSGCWGESARGWLGAMPETWHENARLEPRRGSD